MLTNTVNQMREHLLQCYGVDIQDAKMHFSTQNYAFIFPDRPYMIRVSITPQKTRKEILSELMWLDDLKAFTNTICEPSESLRGKLLEEFEIDGVMYRAAMFRTARGNVKRAVDMNPMFFICVGELLGNIHKVSTDEQNIGMRFVRRTKAEDIQKRLEQGRDRIPPQILTSIEQIVARVDALPQTLGSYGLCHGDFHLNNFFVEHNNIWLFDFDGCCYAHYLYDVASFIQACLLYGYKAGEDMRKVVYTDILPWFRIGYELNHKGDEGYWDQLELFLAYRTALSYLALLDIASCGVTDDLAGIKQFFAYLLTQPDIMDAMTTVLKQGMIKP